MYKAAVLLLSILSTSIWACSVHEHCKACTEHSSQGIWMTHKCQWCPLTGTCHYEGSMFNDCDKFYDQSIATSSQCDGAADPPMFYDSNLAEMLAKFSSLAYVEPRLHNMSAIQSIFATLVHPQYQLVEFLTVEGDWLVNNDYCTAVIAKSEKNNRIVIALEGIASPDQFFQNFLIFGDVLKDFEPTNGKVLRYNRLAHDALYPCIKSLLEELLIAQPAASVMVTGHSLGGALAQLIGVHLVTDKLVSKDKLHVYTFGSPRVGDKEFAYNYDRLMGNSWRVTRKNDPVPIILPKSGNLINLPNSCYHTRKEVYYWRSITMSYATNYRICRANEGEDGCSEHKGICLAVNCLRDEHRKYFTDDVTKFMQYVVPKVTTSHSKMRGNCKAYVI